PARPAVRVRCDTRRQAAEQGSAQANPGGSCEQPQGRGSPAARRREVGLSSMSMRAVAVPAPLRQPARILRLVRQGEITPKARKRRARMAAAFTVCLIGVGLFATVAFHVVLTQNQFRLDHLNDRAAEEQARYQRLRLQVAELESPARIVDA